MRVTKLLALIAAVALLSACEKQKFTPGDLSVETNSISTLIADMNQSYLVISKTNKLPAELEKSLSTVGGVLESTIPEIGVAVANSPDPDFMTKAAKIKGIGDVLPNIKMQIPDPGPTHSFDQEDVAPDAVSGEDEWFFEYQWGLTAIQAPEAWMEGYAGEGVRVGVLDTGFDTDHPDLVDNIDFESSTSFVPGEDYVAVNADHGTHTAGIIAAADNGIGSIGVAPKAKLVLIQVLNDEGSGEFSWTLEGIIHAADEGCDVVNMSLGGYSNHAISNAEARFLSLMNRVCNYANQMGTTLIASSGNEGYDLDHVAGWLHLPSDAVHVLSISATGPRGWNFDDTYLDDFASYSNFGQSRIAFAAPGGDATLYPNGAWYLDMVFSTVNGAWWGWMAGTSQAAPHAAGVAALIIGKNGGDMKPAQVKAALRQSADDLGKPGKDDFYGHGRVNAYNAVK